MSRSGSRSTEAWRFLDVGDVVFGDVVSVASSWDDWVVEGSLSGELGGGFG